MGIEWEYQWILKCRLSPLVMTKQLCQFANLPWLVTDDLTYSEWGNVHVFSIFPESLGNSRLSKKPRGLLFLVKKKIEFMLDLMRRSWGYEDGCFVYYPLVIFVAMEAMAVEKTSANHGTSSLQAATKRVPSGYD